MPDQHPPDPRTEVPRQEVGTHGVSHFHCQEPEQTPNQFRAGPAVARKAARAEGVALESIAFRRRERSCRRAAEARGIESQLERGRRRHRILAAAGYGETPLPAGRCRRVAGANDAAADPQAVLVNGARILSRGLLETIAGPVLNIHAGTTPACRGVHGGDRADCGVTAHPPDAATGTGGVVARAAAAPAPQGDFATSAAPRLAAGVPRLSDAVRAAQAGRLTARPAAGESRQYHHPTLWGYVAAGPRRGVW